MDSAPEIATILDDWLSLFGVATRTGASARGGTASFREVGAPADNAALTPALAALAAEALARDRSLWIVTADDAWLPDISNALDLRLRPLCLVMPGAEYAGRIALRATLSLLKSRLARAADDSAGPAWAAMRARLQADDALWRASLAWSTRGLDREAPPAGIAGLFPVRIAPWSLAQSLAAPADWVMMVQAGQLPADLRTPWPGASHTLLLAAAISGVTDIAIIDATARLRAEIEVIGQELAEMELELATAQGELAVFSERYQKLIGERMSALDGLHAELARLRLLATPHDASLDAAAQGAAERAERSRREHEQARQGREPANQPFNPGNDLKKRYRQLAQKIHPDRAGSETERTWRTQLMSEANRAYRAGDAAALEEVFSLWLAGQTEQRPDHSAESVGTAATLAQQAARIRQRIAAIAAELDRLYGSKLYELFSAARVASRQGRDLLEEMAARLDLQIEAARGELKNLGAAAGA